MERTAKIGEIFPNERSSGSGKWKDGKAEG